MSKSNQTTETSTTTAGARRRKWLIAVAATVAVAAGAYGAYYAAVLRHHESTDNAYVQGNLVQITPQVSGTVISIGADDTDFVKTGQELVKLDTADAQVALDQAEAQLAQTVREVRSLYSSNGTLAAQIALREADVEKARSDLAKADDDVQRRAALTSSGAVGKEEFNHATAQLASSRSAVPSRRRRRHWRPRASNWPRTRRSPTGRRPKRTPACSVPRRAFARPTSPCTGRCCRRLSTAMSPSEAFRSVSVLLRARR